nr:hypothetical protein [Nocardiopsis mwathae]
MDAELGGGFGDGEHALSAQSSGVAAYVVGMPDEGHGFPGERLAHAAGHAFGVEDGVEEFIDDHQSCATVYKLGDRAAIDRRRVAGRGATAH